MYRNPLNYSQGGHPTRRVPSATNLIVTPRQNMKKVFDRSKLPDGTVILEPSAMDDCIIDWGGEDNRLTYCYIKLLQYFQDEEGFTMDESIDWIDYNIEGLHMVNIKYPDV